MIHKRDAGVSAKHDVAFVVTESWLESHTKTKVLGSKPVITSTTCQDESNKHTFFISIGSFQQQLQHMSGRVPIPPLPLPFLSQVLETSVT